eukprot:scaffold20971_cov225-Skeletonema_marinoi.AAC.3
MRLGLYIMQYLIESQESLGLELQPLQTRYVDENREIYTVAYAVIIICLALFLAIYWKYIVMIGVANSDSEGPSREYVQRVEDEVSIRVGNHYGYSRAAYALFSDDNHEKSFLTTTVKKVLKSHEKKNLSPKTGAFSVACLLTTPGKPYPTNPKSKTKLDF